jgi:uncharacterized integral membrane protein (TIGR00698 family)
MKCRSSFNSARGTSLFQSTIAILGVVACFTPWATPSRALFLGLVSACFVRNPSQSNTKVLARLMLQSSVILLGAGMDIHYLLQAGIVPVLLTAVSIALTLGLSHFLGVWLRIPFNLSTLIGAGTAICGGSAIAATGATLNAVESEITVALSTIFILNALSLFLFPYIGAYLDLSSAQFGVWSGIAIHDISSVVGAASVYGDEALYQATTVKLARTLWIIPLCVATNFFVQQRSSSPRPRHFVRVPWFILLFILLSCARTLIPRIAVMSDFIIGIAKQGMVLSLYLIGLNLSLKTLASLGPRPFLHGTLLWITVSVLSLLAVVAIIP